MSPEEISNSMDASHMNAADQHESVDDQYRKRLMVDELIEQLIRRQIAETRSVQDCFESEVS